MTLFMVTILEADEDERTPDDWPIASIDLTVEAKDDEMAEQIADDVIAAIQKARNVEYAMVIDSVTEV